MRKTIGIISILFFLSISSAIAQKIEVDCVHKPLNELLLEWRNQYQVQFSYNDKLLSQYNITRKQSFVTVDDALVDILSGLPLNFEVSGSVYIIYPVQHKPITKNYRLMGKIVEAGTGEPLAFSHVVANNQQVVSDLKGAFSFSFQNDSVYHVKASHLGCYIIDTMLVAGSHHIIELTPSIVGIKEVVVTNNIVEKSTQIGEAPGLTSLNHHIANYLPGNGDNSVFNLLRLQPGILAAGEQPNDLIIWGSPEGTTRVLFDGFTIWGLKNFNDNISAVNPYLAKDIEIQKGGYNATYDDVVGGIVNISGKNGSTINPGLNLFINNQTLNGMVELPLSKKSSFMIAFRQTYYNLFGSEDFNYFDNNELEINAVPDYQFRDFNLKYSLQGDNGDLFYVSMLRGADNFEVEETRGFVNSNWEQEREEENTQLGATVYYGKSWNNGNTSNFQLSYSALKSNYNLFRQIVRIKNQQVFVRKDEEAQNDVGELSIKWKNTFLFSPRQSITVGAEFIQNQVVLTEDTFSIRYINLNEASNRINLFVQDRIQLAHKLSLTAGLRYNHYTFIKKLYFDPRLSLSYRPTGNLKLNASWGRYHQFLVKSSVVDEDGNYRYTWAISDNDEVPVIESEHYVFGAAYTNQNFLFSIDAFNKQNTGLTRYLRWRGESSIYNGKSRSYGVDFYAKQDFKGHSVWASYSLSKTEELFPFFTDGEYRRSSQDQRHEIKLAGLFNLRSFHFSASFVHGSGFPFYASIGDAIENEYSEKAYNRLDASAVYKLSSQSFTGEVGISILNLTKANNVKYNQFSRVPYDQVNTVYINSEAVPFTPLLYLKVHF